MKQRVSFVAGFMLLRPEDTDDMTLRNVSSLSTDYMASYLEGRTLQTFL
jgi:hypothetical protein